MSMHFVPARKSRPVVPIVPLLDILAILLIFVMLHWSTSASRKDYLQVDIPKVTNLETSAETRTRVALEVADNGEMRLAGAPMNMRGLAGALRKLKQTKPDARLELRADHRIPLQTLLEMWEIFSTTGFPIREVPVRVQVYVDERSNL